MSERWKDRVVQHPKRYELKDTSTGLVVATYDIEAAPGIVTEAGTYVTAARMNEIQDAIFSISLGGLIYI